MTPMTPLSRVHALRTHRALVAAQAVQAAVRLVREREQQLRAEQDCLDACRHALKQSESAAAQLLQPGGAGARFADFVAHARLVRDRLQVQRLQVDRAREAVVHAESQLEVARASLLAAQKAEQKTEHARDATHTLVRLQAVQREAEQLDELAGLQYRSSHYAALQVMES